MTTRVLDIYTPPCRTPAPTFTIQGDSYDTRMSGINIEEMPLEIGINGPVTIVLEETDENHEIRYSTNGKHPTSKSKLYTGPLVLAANLSGSDNTAIRARMYSKLNPSVHSRIVRIRIRVL